MATSKKQQTQTLNNSQDILSAFGNSIGGNQQTETLQAPTNKVVSKNTTQPTIDNSEDILNAFNNTVKKKDIGDESNISSNQSSENNPQSNLQVNPNGEISESSIPIVNFDNQISQLRDLQQKAKPVPTDYTETATPGGFVVPNKGIYDEQKNAQVDYETNLNSLASVWNVKPEDLKQVLNDLPNENNASQINNLVQLKNTNPVKYQRIASMRNLQYDIANKAGVKIANEFNDLNKDYTSLNDLEENAKAQQNIINHTFSGDERILAQQQLQATNAPLINITKPDILKQYFDPKTNPLKPIINENQFAGLKTLQIFQPERYNQYFDALKKSQDIKYASSDYLIGIEKIKKELENIGINNLQTESNEKIGDINSALATETSPEKLQQYKQQFEKITDTLKDIPFREAKYPLLDAVKQDEQIKDALGYNPNFGSNIKTVVPYKISKGAIGEPLETLNNIFTNILGSEADKTNLMVQKKGESILDSDYEYLPEGYRSTGLENIYQFPQDVIDKVSAIQKNNKLTDEEKLLQQSQVLKDNKDKIRLAQNPNADRAADFFSKATLYHNLSMIGDVAGFAAQSYLMGGTGSALSKTQRMINAAVPMFLSTQNDFYKDAIDKGIENPLAYANTHATIMAAAGLINSDLNIVKKALGLNTTAGKLIAGIDEKTWNKVLSENPQRLQRLTNSIKTVATEAGKMAAVYGAGTQIANDVADKLFFNQPISAKDILNNAAKASKDITLNSLLLFGVGFISNFKNITPFDKQKIYELADTPETTTIDIKANTDLTNAEKEKRVGFINTLSGLKTQIPKEVDNAKDRHDYLYNLLLKKRAENIPETLPEQQKLNIEQEANEADNRNNQILSKTDFTNEPVKEENKIEEKPIEEGNALSQPEQQQANEASQKQENVGENLSPQQEKFVRSFITGDDAQHVKNTLDRINNAEYINEKDLDKAADALYTLHDKVNNQSLQNLIEPLINKIEQYDFRTKTESSTVTEKVPIEVANKSRKPTVANKSLSQWEGNRAAVIGNNGKTIEGQIKSDNGKYALFDNDGNKVADLGEKAITDRDIALPDKNEVDTPIGFDKDGNVKSITLQLNKLDKETGKRSPDKKITIQFKDPDKALDYAIQLRAEQVGEIPQPEFDLQYQEIQKEIQKEVPVKDLSTKKVENKQENENKISSPLNTEQNAIDLENLKQEHTKSIEDLKNKTDETSLKEINHLKNQTELIDKFKMKPHELIEKLRDSGLLTSQCL